MPKISTAYHLLKKPGEFAIALFNYARHLSIMRVLNDCQFIRIAFFVYFHHSINLKNPTTFNEKLNWIKLFYRKNEFTQLVDKYAVKDFVAAKIGEKYVIPTIGVWENENDVPWRELPSQFVIKCTHDSHSYILCDDRENLDITSAKRFFHSKLQNNLYYWAREWPYKNVKPRIIAEALLMSEDGECLRDYKFFCFDGKVKCFKIDFDRFSDHHANYYTREGVLLSIGEQLCPPDFTRTTEIPSTLNEMIHIAEVLSTGIPFVRIDLYSVLGRVYFGEMTFFPAEGFGRFVDEKDDLMLGSWLHLPIC